MDKEILKKEGHSENNDSIQKKRFNLRTLSREQKIILTLSCVTDMLSYLSYSVIAPFFPKKTDEKNVSRTISGWIFGSFSLVAFLSSPVFGKMVPYVGSKFMYVSGIFIIAGSTMIFGMLDRIDTTESITTFVMFCFATRILLALGCTATANAGLVILIKAFPHDVSTVFGFIELFTGLGLVAGPAFGGPLYKLGGFFLPFGVIGTFVLICMTFVWICLPPQDDSIKSDGQTIICNNIIQYPRALVNSIVIVVGAAAITFFDPTLEPYLRPHGLGPERVSIYFLIMAATYSFTAPIFGRIADRMPDPRTILITGLFTSCVALLLAGPSQLLGFQSSYYVPWLLFFSVATLGVASSMSLIPTYDIYMDVVRDLNFPEDTKSYGVISGLWVSMYSLGEFSGPSLGGFLGDMLGFQWLVTFFALLCAFTGTLVGITWYLETKFCRKISTTEYTEMSPITDSH